MNAEPLDARVLDRLFATIISRRSGDPDASYTARLLVDGVPKIARKTGEEAIETIVAALADGPDRVTSESADLLYHLLVLWAAAGVRAEDVWAELARREGTSGLTEKASRNQRSEGNG
ncbi:MAG: phosphoribosyl-ATP diphosphatase [Rhodospirillales bacterium]|nr:phosphoribosyl-ATP diphosphatase [Rhodospirillales bacterium]